MLRTFVYLPDQLDQKISATAKSQGKSKAEIIRQALERGITSLAHQSTSSAQLLAQLTHLDHGHTLHGPKDSSQRIDELLWDTDWFKKHD